MISGATMTWPAYCVLLLPSNSNFMPFLQCIDSLVIMTMVPLIDVSGVSLSVPRNTTKS